MKSHRLSRRMVLTEFGRGTIAVSILGTAVISCSSGDEDEPAPTADGSADQSADTTTQPTEEPSETAAPSTDPPADEPSEGEDAPALRWERVSFDFVSAYVLARGNEVALVDTGVSGGADRFTGAFDAMGVGWPDVDHVLLTHLHPDHIGGLGPVLEAAPDAIGYAGELDLAAINSPRPLQGVNDGDEVFGLRIIGTPGHTAGHISILDPTAGLLVAGDALRERDGQLLGPDPDFTDDLGVAHQSVRDLVGRDIDTALVGHGNPIVGMADEALAALVASL